MPPGTITQERFARNILLGFFVVGWPYFLTNKVKSNAMPLRDQPYLPLYVQDFLTDEKLMECSASATGIYIKIMCIMHKSNEYGTILLRQKDKQTDQQILNFAKKIAKYLPYSADEIKVALTELTNEGVLTIESDKLFQKRMVRDNEISIARAEAGSKGGFAKAKKIAKRLPKKIANTEYENEYENENNNIIEELYNNVVIFFDENCRPKTDSQKMEWHNTLEKLVRIDGYSPEHIQNIIKRTRMDDFWRTNFLSVLKLRKKNKEGIPYFIVFEKRNHTKPEFHATDF